MADAMIAVQDWLLGAHSTDDKAQRIVHMQSVSLAALEIAVHLQKRHSQF